MLAPCASPSPCGSELAWIDTNRVAPASRAILYAVGERHEGVVGAGQQHPILAGFLEAFAQALREVQNDIFFFFATRPLGAGVDAAVSWIEHDERTLIAFFY